jgi:hypothetical protein
VPARGFHQGQDSGRRIKSPWRGVQRVGFLAKWPESGVSGRFAGSGRFHGLRGEARTGRWHVLKFQHFKRTHHRIVFHQVLKIQQMDRDREIENSTRGAKPARVARACMGGEHRAGGRARCRSLTPTATLVHDAGRTGSGDRAERDRNLVIAITKRPPEVMEIRAFVASATKSAT